MERRYKVPESRTKKPQRFGFLDSRRGKDENESFGVWTPQAVKRENAVSFTAEVVGGGVFALCGAALAYVNGRTFMIERAQFGGASLNIGAWLLAIGLMLIGVFLAHAGIIYWWRQLFGKKTETQR